MSGLPPPPPPNQQQYPQQQYQPPRRKGKIAGAVAAIVVVVLIILTLILMDVIPLRAPTGSGSFTGAKIFTDPYASWYGSYSVRLTSTWHTGSFDGQGNKEYAIDCPSGYTMQVTISSWNYSASITLETWVRGEMRESTTGTTSLAAGAVC